MMVALSPQDHACFAKAARYLAWCDGGDCRVVSALLERETLTHDELLKIASHLEVVLHSLAVRQLMDAGYNTEEADHIAEQLLPVCRAVERYLLGFTPVGAQQYLQKSAERV